MSRGGITTVETDAEGTISWGRIDWKPILLWGGGTGALIGLWWGGWIVGFLTGWERGWLYPGLELAPEKWEALCLCVPAEVALRQFSDLVNISLPTRLVQLVCLVTFLGAITGSFVASLGRMVSLDPQNHGIKSLVWSLRSTFRPSVALAWLTIGIPMAGAILIDVLAIGLLPLMLGWLVLVPMLVCRKDVVATTPAGRWWQPWWPGLKPMGILVGLGVLVYLPDELFSLVLGDGPGGLAMEIASFLWGILTISVPLLMARTFLVASHFEPWDLRMAIRWSVLGPWLALQGLWAVVVLVILPPILACYVWVWKFVPLLASVLEAQGEYISYLLGVFIAGINFVGRFWWLLMLVPILFLFWFGVGRLVVLTSSKKGL